MKPTLTTADLHIITTTLHNNFQTRNGNELIFDGHFHVGNKSLCNRLDCFVTSYQIETLRRYFGGDELLIGRIVETLN